MPELAALRVSRMKLRKGKSMWKPDDFLNQGDGAESLGRTRRLEFTEWSSSEGRTTLRENP